MTFSSPKDRGIDAALLAGRNRRRGNELGVRVDFGAREAREERRGAHAVEAVPVRGDDDRGGLGARHAALCTTVGGPCGPALEA